MKLHLPISLRRSLLSLVLSAAAAIPAWAGVLTNDADAWVYADFGQNRGRYSVTNVNALLRDLNADGVYIHYNNGHDSYKLENGMISFESRQEAGGSSAAINHNFIATVQHNGVQNPYFSYLELGGEKHAIQYKGIEYRGPYGGAFLHDKSGRDFKITRLNKIVTDVTTSSVYSVEKLKEEGLAGKLLYHSGGGRTFIYDPDTETYLPMENPDDSYNVNGTLGHFIQGAIQKIDSMGGPADGGFWFDHTVDGWNLDTDPLPFGAQSGDSGSPVWVWDDDAKEYKYIAVVQQSSDNPAYGASMSNLTYMQEVADSYDKVVESSQSVISIGSTENTHQTISQDSVSTTLWQGKVTDAGGILASFTGVEQGKSTWNDMVAIRDEDNWYALTQNYLNARQNNTDDSSLDYADLFMTDNLVFNAKGRTDYTIQVDSVVDTGIGYTEFTKGNQDKASYTISGKGYLDSAGYIIGEDVEVHLQLLSTGKTREVRKIGDGTLYVDGTGDNDIMLNLGGKGSTILNQTNGYAAYNVLANNGTTVQLLGGISQIKRDFTFGNGGATLDFAGHDWTEGDHFSMKALTQDAVITNSSDRTIQLNFTKGGSWLGSFADTAKAGIQVNYSGTGTWELNSIHTHLQHKDSGLTVSDGHVIFQGTITEHGISQLIYPEKNANGWNEAMCWQKENDWHYADARMNVTVDKGVFELGSHARLTGTVTVNSNASYIMREGVQNRYEYIEGGYAPEDTYAISEYYGHKGNTVLNGGTLQVEFSDGTSSNLTYAGDITGSGSITVDTVDGSLTLTGNNTFSGSKTLEGGHLIAEDTAALGTGSGWKLDAGTTLTVQSGLTSENALTFVDAANSSGLLALGNNLNRALNLPQGSDLYIGAEAGKVVQYGAEDETITAPKLGGGGGTLVVNAAVAAEDLVVGRDNDSGVVRLTNEANQLSGTISMAGNVALDATSAALGNARVNLAYGKGLVLREPVSVIQGKLTGDSAGSLLLDFYTADSVNMTGMTALSLSAAADDAVYAGTIQVGASESYRLGGYTGSLFLSNHAALTGANALVVDAKGTTGGKVVLAKQTLYTGAVTVQDGSPGKNGSVSLCFSEDNALADASSVTLDKCGILDVGSTTQTLTNLVVKTGGLLRGDADGTLVFNMTATVNGNPAAYFQTGAMQLGKVEKTGAGEMVLASADNSWDLFTVKQGTLFTRVNNALSATGITRVENGAILSMNAWDANRTMHGNVVLVQGGRMETGGGNNIFFNGTISVDDGATGTLGAGTWYLTHTRHNIDGGTLKLEGGNLRFESTDAQRVGGTLDIATNDVTFHSISANGADNMLKQFDAINVASGKALNVVDHTWNTIWQLDKLTGAGSLNWNSTTTHSKTAQLIIGGEGGFSGAINVNRDCDYTGHTRPYQAYLQINSTEAISSATVNLTGADDNNSYVSLALNADRVKVGGLNGNAYSHLFAGTAPSAIATTAPASTRKAALVITGSGNYTYSGSIGAASDFASKGISIEMAGTGVQQFNGSSVVVQNIALQNTGSLDFSGVSSLNVQGNIALNAVGSLNLGDHTYSLDAGNSLSALAAGAGFTANLELNGGTIVFDASALTQAGAMLNYSGTLTSATGATIDFTNLGSLYQSGGNNTYVLASGDWSGVLSSLSGSNLGQYKAEFSVNSDKALVVTFSDNGHIWGGSASSHEWSASGFMTEAGMKEYNASSNLVFRDSAANAVVNVSGSVSASGLYFENSEKDYTVSGNAGDDVSAESISQSGRATTTFTVAASVKNIDVTAGKLDLQKADLNGGRLTVEDGTLALCISEKETASLLYLGKDARFELSGNRRLTVSNGGVKDVAGETSVVLNGSSTILQDVKSNYNIANASLHVKEGTAGQGQMFVRSAQLADGGVLSVDGANLGVTEGIGFNSESDALVEVKNNAVLVLDAVKGKGVLHSSSMPTAEEEESEDEAADDIVVPTHRVMVKDGGTLFSAGSSAEGNLSLELGDNAVLGTSAELADYASDIKLVGSEATLTSNGYYVFGSSELKFSSKKGVLKVSGNIVSEHNHANLVIAGSSTYDVNDVGVQLAGTASVTGDVKIRNSSVLRMVGALGDGDFPGMTYRQDAGVKISSRDGENDAVIAGGSSMGLLANAQAYVYGKETGSTHFSNARIELYSGAALSLKNLTLSDTDSVIQMVEGAQGAATVSMENVNLQISADGSESVLADAMTLQAFGGDSIYTLEAGARVLDITSDMLGGALTVSGDSLEIIFQGYDFNSYDAVRLSFGSDVMLDSGLNISGSLVSVQRSSDGGYVSLTASYEGNGGSTSTIVFVTSSETIPEPATAALSLLGLAALAARRRRKA